MRNLVFDIGGIFLDDSDRFLAKKYGMHKEEILKYAHMCFGKSFQGCLLGTKTLEEHIDEVIKENPDEDKDIIRYTLEKENYDITIPLYEENIEQLYPLKEKGYKIYFLSNIAIDSFEYINEKNSFLRDFEGGVYSYQVNTIKPKKEIYESLIEKYNLDVNETMFFDDKLKNVHAAEKVGIKGIQFKTFNDVLENI